MSITLIFNGGFFVVMPSAGDRRKVLAYQACPGDAVVADLTGGDLRGLQGELSGATSVDFVSTTPLSPHQLPMRRLSDCLNINYNGFLKVIGFTGGRVTGRLKDPVPSDLQAYHASAKSAGEPKDGLEAFKAFHGIDHSNHDTSYVNDGVVEAFMNTPDTRWWVPGYRIEVELDFGGLICRVNGQPPNNVLKDGLRIEFPIDQEDPDCHPVIPHYEHNNPHVLEQPPTI